MDIAKSSPNNALVRMQTTLRFVCTAQLGRWRAAKAGRIWSGESPGMARVNHPPLPSVVPLAER